MSETKSMLPKDFEPIRSAKDKRANAVEIRRLVKLSGGKSFRGGAGFLEASIEDIRAKGGSMFGRCAMHPEAAVGIKTYGLKVPKRVPCEKDAPGAKECKWGYTAGRGWGWGEHYYRPITKEEAKEARRELKAVKFLIGCNMNGSTIGKCQTAASFLKLGIRCQLCSGGELIVDNWPDYDRCEKAMTDFKRKYHVSGCCS